MGGRYKMILEKTKEKMFKTIIRKKFPWSKDVTIHNKRTYSAPPKNDKAYSILKTLGLRKKCRQEKTYKKENTEFRFFHCNIPKQENSGVSKFWGKE